MNVQFLPEARAELLDAVAYYEGELSDLACDFGTKSISTSRGSSEITKCRVCDSVVIAE